MDIDSSSDNDDAKKSAEDNDKVETKKQEDLK